MDSLVLSEEVSSQLPFSLGGCNEDHELSMEDGPLSSAAGVACPGAAGNTIQTCTERTGSAPLPCRSCWSCIKLRHESATRLEGNRMQSSASTSSEPV